MKRALVAVFALLGLLSAPARPQCRLQTDSLYAESLGREKRFTVLLPVGYADTSSYPVLYLLHGLWGSHIDWTSKTRLQQYAEPYAILIVMPDAEDSWYLNARAAGQDRFEDYVTADLPAYVQRHYSIDTLHQAIAGLSMGGYGALMLGLRHSPRFFFAGGLSSILIVPREIGRQKVSPGYAALAPSVLAAFGPEPGLHHESHDIFRLSRMTGPRVPPYIYLVTGIQDHYESVLPAHRELADSLRVRNAAYEYHEVPGGHTWQFWDREIQPLLRRMSEILSQRKKAQGTAG